MIRNQDSYGHRVVLNFNRNGDTFKTKFGGVVSIFVKLCLLGYLLLRIWQMNSRSLTTFSEYTVPTDYDTIGTNNDDGVI